jgi:DeoR/GlpR family transcriptional regulator of sugar metabolism
MKRALAGRAAETYVLGSAEKIGTASPFGVLDFGEVSGVITDADPDTDTMRLLRRRVRILPA